MALESLGNVIRDSDKGKSLSRIYRAHLLQEKIVGLLGVGVTVTMRDANIKLWCNSEQLAVLARLKKTRILALCHRVLGVKEIRLTIKVKRLG